MFEQTFVQSQARTRNPWTVAVSLSLQCVAVGIVLLIPLLHPETLRIPELPQPHLIRTWIASPPSPPRTVTAARAALAAPAAAASRPIFVLPSARVSASPQIDLPSVESAPTAWEGPSTMASGSWSGVAILPLPRTAVQPPAVAPSAKPTSGPVKVSAGVQGARLAFGPVPVYPPLARATHSQGVVKLEAVIAADGSIRNLHVVSGPPLLIDAALDAVRQWRYQPTLLDGLAVEVITEIDVNFTLSR